MKSIAIITSQAFSLVNFRGPLIRDLVACQVKVYALAPDFNDELRHTILVLGAQPVDFSLARTGMNPLRDGLDTIRLALLLRRLRPDVTLAYFIKPVIYGTLAAWLARVPHRVGMIEGLGYVFTPSGNSVAWRRQWLQRAVSGFYRLSLAKAHKVIFLNPDDISEFVGNGLIEEKKAANLGGIGVDLNEWFPVPVVKKPMTFLLAARLLREKGIIEYAEAARRVKADHPEARFVLLGGLDPNPGGLSKAEVQGWVEEGVLEWPGHVPVKPWLAQASVYVLPSYREGVPRSTQEAMAMGRPVITTDAPGCRETVVEGENGFLVPVHDPEALARAMLCFIERPQLVETMGRVSRTLAEERFDVNKINAKILGWLGVA
jgi:glycosyltransferase involved in cell wall biosynthesis